MCVCGYIWLMCVDIMVDILGANIPQGLGPTDVLVIFGGNYNF